MQVQTILGRFSPFCRARYGPVQLELLHLIGNQFAYLVPPTKAAYSGELVH
jgi:hypothetical protein